MDRKERRTNLYLALLLPLGVLVAAWAIYRFPVEKVNIGLIGLSIITIFFSSYLRIQLPRAKIHLTVSDALIFLALIMYGGEVAVLLALLETTVTSIGLKRQGLTVTFRTVLINTLIAGLSVFVTNAVVLAFLGRPDVILKEEEITRFIVLLAVMTVSQFLLNSISVAAFTAIRTGKTLWTVWYETCLNALVLYFSGALMAGLLVKAWESFNVFLLGAVVGFFSLVYLTYRRYVDDIKATAAKAEQAERERAEQAEVHVKQLQHYVRKLEQSSEELQQSHEKLEHAAYHDALTGLPNKNYFIEKIKGLLQNCRQMSGSPFAILYLDLNRFKTINDSVGHSRGDRLIQHVAERLREIVGESDIVGRFSGDEFAIIVPAITNEQNVITLAETVAKRLAEPFSLYGRDVFTSACVGIAFGNRDYKHAENVLRDADIAMYHAKDTKQKYVVFDQQMHAKAVNLMQIETDLRCAIERNEFELYYQPIVTLKSLSLAGFEALIRWNHPSKGLVSPGEFISVSEATDMIVPLTLMVLEHSCRQVGEWSRTEQGSHLFVSVNLSGKHFDQPDLVDHVKQILVDTGFEPTLLKLEITETAVMENAEIAVSMLRAIKELGVQICIDDFGTGYSSLNYLHRFPIDTLKIDRSFVSSIERGNENSEIVRTIVYLAKALNLSVVAEGIESIRQLHQLELLGCEYGQGYLFSRPLPAGQIESLLVEGLHWRGLLSHNEFGFAWPNPDSSDLRLLG